MPAHREVQYHHNLEDVTVRVEPVDPKDIYFTDEAPEFDLIVRNNTETRLTTREGYGIF